MGEPHADIRLYYEKDQLRWELPDSVQQSRSTIFDKVIDGEQAAELERLTTMEVENNDLPGVKTRLILSYGRSEEEITDEPNGIDRVHSLGGLNAFDRMIMETVASLNFSGIEIVHPLTIYRVMSGDTKKSKISAKMRNAIEASLDKCASCRINLSMEADGSRSADPAAISSIQIKTYLLNATAILLDRYGKKSFFYKLHEFPAIYQYADRLVQNRLAHALVKIPIEVFDTPVNKTEQTLLLQDFLVRKISDFNVDHLERPYNRDYIIFWNSIYQSSENETGTRQGRARVRSRVTTMLNYWIQMGYIREYKTTNSRILIDINHEYFLRWNPVSPVLISEPEMPNYKF